MILLQYHLTFPRNSAELMYMVFWSTTSVLTYIYIYGARKQVGYSGRCPRRTLSQQVHKGYQRVAEAMGVLCKTTGSYSHEQCQITRAKIILSEK